MSDIRIETFPDKDGWADACAGRLAGALVEGLNEGGKALLAGAGGSTPSPIYRRLANADLDWSRVAVTLVDERHVPESSPDSNARLMRETLLTGRAAAMAAKALQAEGPLDAVLLGMGEDGHICSMFPGSPTLKTLLTTALEPAVLGVPPGRDGMAPPQERISLNIPYLAGARRVVLALTGAKKRAVFEAEATGDPAVQPIAALIASGAPLEVLWTE